MSILSEIGRLADAKTDIIAAIIECGVTVPDGVHLDELADYIRMLIDTKVIYFDGGAVVQFSATSEYQCDVTIGDTIKCAGGYGQTVINGCVATAIKQDISDISKITFTFSEVINKGNACCRIGVNANNTSNPFVGNDFAKNIDVSTAGDYTLDVSDLTGSYYILIVQVSSTESGSGFTCTKIVGE